MKSKWLIFSLVYCDPGSPLSYLTDTKELSHIEQYVRHNTSILLDLLNDDNNDTFNFIRSDPLKSDLTEDFFRELMVSKCSIPQRKFDKLTEFYGDYQTDEQKKCEEQLKQFNADLIEGQFHALQMCDAWGEDINFRNWPGLMQEITQPSFFSRTKRPGHINQCRQVTRREDEGGKLLYRGQFVMSYPLFHRIKQYGKQFIECANTCAELDTAEAQGACVLECYQGKGVENIKLLDYYRGRGLCYPDACSAEEILILQSNVGDVNTISNIDDAMTGANGQMASRHAFTSALRMDIRTWTSHLESVHNPTMISYLIFMGCILLCVMGASTMKDRGKENLFVAIFAYQTPWSKLTTTKRSQKVIKCIDGIRSLSMVWVMMGHLWMGGLRMDDTRQLYDQLKNGEWSLVYNGTPSVDSFFVIGAVLLAYLSTDALIKKLSSVKDFIVGYTIYLVNRWMRLTPYIMVVAWTLVAIFPLFAVGHINGTLVGSSRLCETDLWRSFFYLSSWLDPASQLCNAVQWYLSCDFFYYALFPFCAILYGRQRAMGVVLVSFMILVSFGYQLWTSLDSESYIYQTYRVYSTWPQDQKHDPYFTPWARYHSHGIGILFGWIILNERKHGSIRNWLDKQKVWAKYLMITSAWMVSLGLMWFTVWGPNLCFRVNWKEHPNYWSINSLDEPAFSGCFAGSDGRINWIATSIWNASIRMIWCVGLGLLIMLCDLGYGFVIDWFLCGKIWVFLGKCSFGMYLWHVNIINVMEATRKSVVYNDGYYFFFGLSSLITVTCIISIIFNVLIESPTATAWGLVLKWLTKPKKAATIEMENKEDTNVKLEEQL